MNDILDAAIRKVPDFPKPGVLFYDITGILVDPKAFAYCIDRMTELYAGQPFDGIAAIESRGFIFAAPYAHRRGLPPSSLRRGFAIAPTRSEAPACRVAYLWATICLVTGRARSHPLRLRIWAAEPGGPCTCRSSGRCDVGGGVRQTPCPPHKLASAAHPPTGACRASCVRSFFSEPPCCNSPPREAARRQAAQRSRAPERTACLLPPPQRGMRY